jgi:uncharacterized protein
MKNWRRYLLVFAVLISIFGTACLYYAFFFEPDKLVVNNYEIKIKDWNREFDGLKIVAISDVHGGANYIDEAKLRKIVELANQQNPDVIVLLGDYVSQKGGATKPLRMPIETIAENLQGLKAKFGVYAVLGNHDGWYSDAFVGSALRNAGYKVLENEAIAIEKNGQKIRILGLKDHLTVTDWETFRQDAKNSLAKIEDKGDIIVLEHSPDVFPEINKDEFRLSKDFKLMLAGHTHGGQVWFPILGTPIVPSSYGQKYSYGEIIEHGVHLFVTTGIGTSISPIRFMMPPEIAVLTIRSA